MDKKKITTGFLALVFLLPFIALGEGDKEACQQYEGLEENSQTETKDFLNLRERERLLDQVSSHPVTSLSNLTKYDPQGFVGFCFGRAMGAHLMGRKMGLRRDSIRKLFIIGDLRSGPDPEWRFHVTTLVRGAEDKAWHAIDPIMTYPIANGKPLRLESWVAAVQKVWDKEKKAKLYMTSSWVVFPDVTQNPDGATGNHIIELVFDPADKKGFTPGTQGKVLYYELDRGAEDTYMISVREPEKDRFNFEGVTIDKNFISYNGYFIKLLGDLSGVSPIPRERFLGMQPWAQPSKPSLGSMKLHKLRKQRR